MASTSKSPELGQLHSTYMYTHTHTHTTLTQAAHMSINWRQVQTLLQILTEGGELTLSHPQPQSHFLHSPLFATDKAYGFPSNFMLMIWVVSVLLPECGRHWWTGVITLMAFTRQSPRHKSLSTTSGHIYWLPGIRRQRQTTWAIKAGRQFEVVSLLSLLWFTNRPVSSVEFTIKISCH